MSDPWADVLAPEDDGIYLMDFITGKSKLIISLFELLKISTTEEMRGVYHWVNHIQINPKGDRFAFFHLWRKGKNGWGVRIYSAKMDGTGLHCVLDTDIISHYDWMDDRKILIWVKSEETKGHFVLCDVFDGMKKIVGEDILTEDGHCSFSPNRKWILNDTYPDAFNMRNLMLYQPSGSKKVELERLYSPKTIWWGEFRCDLHPRWSRDGKKICIDSVHTGSRQLYIMDVANII